MLDLAPAFSCWKVQNFLTAVVDWTSLLLFHDGRSRISSRRRGIGPRSCFFMTEGPEFPHGGAVISTCSHTMTEKDRRTRRSNIKPSKLFYYFRQVILYCLLLSFLNNSIQTYVQNQNYALYNLLPEFRNIHQHHTILQCAE